MRTLNIIPVVFLVGCTGFSQDNSGCHKWYDYFGPVAVSVLVAGVGYVGTNVFTNDVTSPDYLTPEEPWIHSYDYTEVDHPYTQAGAQAGAQALVWVYRDKLMPDRSYKDCL